MSQNQQLSNNVEHPLAVEDSSQKSSGPPIHEVASQVQFSQILDICSSYQAGNYDPLLHCYNYDLIPKDFIDNTGYHPFHNAVASNQIPVALTLLNHFKIDPNVRSRNNQTPLMIAANYGHLELIKILCDHGAIVNEQEDTRFSALTYAVKQDHVPIFAYLLSQGSDIRIQDANGCTLAHWAAYKNNVFMLKTLKRLGLDLNAVDSMGMTPIDRAVQSDAFQTAEYLLSVTNKELPSKMDLSKVTNSDMRKMLRRKYYKTKFEARRDQLMKYLKQNSKILTVSFYVSFWIVSMIMYFHAIMFQDLDYVFSLIFVIFSLYFVGYANWYFSKPRESLQQSRSYQKIMSTSQEMDLESPNSSIIGREADFEMNYGILDKIVQNKNRQSSDGVQRSDSQTFLHELAYFVHKNNYKEAVKFNELDYCPTCLKRRPYRSAHIVQEKSCVEGFHHYSYCLRRSVTHQDHYLYFILLAKQTLLLSLFLVQIWKSYNDKANNWKVFLIEVGYVIFEEYGILYSGFYGLTLILWGYSLWFLLIEVYGIAKNITWHEIFNQEKCKYLYKVRTDRGNMFVRQFCNPYNKGILKNIKTYLSRIFE